MQNNLIKTFVQRINYCGKCGNKASPLRIVVSTYKCPNCLNKTFLPGKMDTVISCLICEQLFRTGDQFCPNCGTQRKNIESNDNQISPSSDIRRSRVSEDEVARILNLIAHPPNQRKHPREDDVRGNFKMWFDGGATRIDTGIQTFYLADGTKVLVAKPVSLLSVEIVFPDGRQVAVKQFSAEQTEPGE